MAFDAAQILRQTYAAGAEAAKMRELAEPARAPAPPVQRGELMGTAFAVEADPMAELMDSMEELSFQFEEKSALSAGNPLSERELLKELSRGSTDPSHQFAMLDILEQALGEGEDALRALVRQAKATLTAEKGAEIRAGINLAEEVNARATTPEEMRELRDMYRSEVVGFTKPQECFRSLLAARGAEGLKDAIGFLIAGCGADLQSSSPSMEAAALGRILTDLQCVQVLQTVLDALTALGKRMDKQFGETCLLDGEQMAGRVLDFTEQSFVASPAIAAFIADCGMRALLARMDFARELTGLFRKLSPRLFAREGDRQKLVDAAQEHLDELITEENDAQGGAS